MVTLKVQISLTDFVDFVLKTGTPRLTKVREIKDRDEYHPAFDFWRQLREGIEELHRSGYHVDWLDSIALKQTDPRKINRYPEAIAAYKKFVGRKKLEWFEPPKDKWISDDLTININPELGLFINGTPHIIKLFFKDDSLDKRKSEVVLHLMEEQFRESCGPQTVMSILDVKSSRLISPTKSPENISILLRAEANTFIQIYNAL